MKKVTLFFAAILVAASLQAAIRTVSNNPATAGQFSTIQAAVDVSDDGDTIYVHGSPNTYPSFNIDDKRLTVIGPGWAPDKNLALQATVSGCNLTNTSNVGSPTGSELQGLIFAGGATLTNTTVTNGAVNNLRIIRCQFNSAVNFSAISSGCLIEGCLFLTTVSFNGSLTYEACIFQNNIFFANSCCTAASIAGLTNAVNIRFDHNLFYSDNGAAAFSGNCRFLNLSNNIFNERDPAASLSSSVFNNNITFNCGTNGDTAWIRNSNVDGGGNVAAKNPQMADQVSVNAGSFSGLLNFTIATGPANNTGSDGKDIGLLFDASGSLNWTNSRNSRLPRIFSMSITNPTVAPGGNLNVTVDARKSN